MPPDDLLNRVAKTNLAFSALGNERFEAHGATFVRNTATPNRYDSNQVALVRADSPDDFEAILRAADDAFAGFSHRMFSIDAATPSAFQARLALEQGYRASDGLVQLLEGELQATPHSVDIREVTSEDDWSLYRELDAMWWLESGTGDDALGPYDERLHDEFMVNLRLKTPPVRRWFACVDGVPRAFFGSWPGENGIGMVEDLFCHPDYRHRGLATTLLAHAVADARARGAGPVIINSEPRDTPKQMYARMGFRPFYVQRTWLKKLV
jgi:GNAT superfamily N-acetyltransferase